MVIPDERCFWSTPAGRVLEAGDTVFTRIDEQYEFLTGIQPIHDSDSVDVQPTFDYGLLQQWITYPDGAARKGLQGMVMATALIAEDGTAFSVIVSETFHEMFNETVMKAVLLTEFTPAMRDGKPVPVWVNIPVKFALR